jgi:hypothetical protein
VPDGTANFIAKAWKMENGHILDGVDGHLGEKFIWQQQHQAHHSSH